MLLHALLGKAAPGGRRASSFCTQHDKSFAPWLARRQRENEAFSHPQALLVRRRFRPVVSCELRASPRREGNSQFSQPTIRPTKAVALHKQHQAQAVHWRDAISDLTCIASPTASAPKRLCDQGRARLFAPQNGTPMPRDATALLCPPSASYSAILGDHLGACDSSV
jgi:hypothetical protein